MISEQKHNQNFIFKGWRIRQACSDIFTSQKLIHTLRSHGFCFFKFHCADFRKIFISTFHHHKEYINPYPVTKMYSAHGGGGTKEVLLFSSSPGLKKKNTRPNSPQIWLNALSQHIHRIHYKITIPLLHILRYLVFPSATCRPVLGLQMIK